MRVHCRDLVFLLVWGLCQSSESSSSCNNHLRMVSAGVSDLVFVPCPSLDSEGLLFYLFKNKDMISSYLCNQSADTCQNTSYNPSVSLTNQTAQLGFTVKVQDQSSHGLYICERKSTFPPPLRTKFGPEQVLVLGESRSRVDPCAGDQCKSGQSSNPVWIVLLVFSCIYSLFVSVIAVFLWGKKRSAECQNDYVNTRPARTQRHRRKRGIHSFTRV